LPAAVSADDIMSAEEMIARHKMPSLIYSSDYLTQIFIL